MRNSTRWVNLHLTTIFSFFAALAHLQVARAAEAANLPATVAATQSGDVISIESRGGPITYKASIDPKNGGDIADLHLPADGPVVAREVNDLFFLGEHGEQYTLRGWTGRSKFVINCSASIVSVKPDEVVVQVKLLTTGTFKILVTDEPAKSELRKAHASYKEKTLDVKRTYTFKPDRIFVSDELLWLHPDMHFKSFYFTAAFMPQCVQGPVHLSVGDKRAVFPVTTSGGAHVPPDISYPFAAENFLKNGYKVAIHNAAASFDLTKSDFYFYEKPWQQDWFQLSGFMYRLAGYPDGKPVTATHEIVFTRAKPTEMPPIVTIQSPNWDARWLDEKGEVPKYKIGDTVQLSAEATNADGSAIPDAEITWEVHIDPWWNTPAAIMRGAHLSYKIPDVVNEEDKTKSKDRPLLAIVTVKAKGNNGVESIEPFAMLVGRGP